MLKHIDEAYAALGAVIVFCHRSSYKDIKDNLDSSITELVLAKLHDVYKEFASWTKCRLLSLNVDDENLEREVFDVIDFVMR
jgi:hypothetical protein